MPDLRKQSQSGSVGDQPPKQSAHDTVHALAMRPKLYPRDIHQLSVGDTRRTGGFAGAASEAAIKVLGNPLRALRPLKEFLNQINAATGSIKFIARQLVGRAGRVAKPAVHAAAQYLVSALPPIRRDKTVRQIGLH